MKGKIIFLLLNLLFINFASSQNLLTNPGFESGSTGVGFVTNGAGYTELTAPFTVTGVSGNFAVIPNPNIINNVDFIYEGDHTSGTGNMLVIDGNTTAGNPRFWSAGNTGAGVTGLTIGATYRFSYWIKSVSNVTGGTLADIRIQVTGGTPPVLTSGSTIAPVSSQSWRHVIYTFVATATTAQIELWNNNTDALGNDFAVDDFMLTDDLMVSANVTNAACVSAADGGITVTGFGGTPPYVNYNVTGGAININNLTGVFPSLPPGVYTVSVTDSALPTAATATLSNIVVGPYITVSPNATILCGGTPITLHAAGSPSGYTWSASPAATGGLTAPNINLANPTVSPTATTVYTVSSTVGACAPITNTVTVTVTNPRPNVSIINSPSCAGSPVTLTANPSPAGTYSFVWTVPSGETNPGNVNSFTANTAGAYSVVVTNTVTTCSSLPTVRNITLNALPNVTSPSDVEIICPGNAATFTVTGTPNSTVTVTSTLNPVPFTTTFFIGPTGTTLWTTPVLNASEIYQMTLIKGFFTLCERDLVPANLTLTVNVVPNGCATVEADNAPNTPDLDLTLCTTGECRTLKANFSDIPSTTTYTVDQIPYCPQGPFDDPSFFHFPLTQDDVYSNIFNLPFNFCFYGTNFNSVQIGDNGVISFGTSYTPLTDSTANSYVHNNTPLSNPGFPGGGYDDNPFRNMILGVYEDNNSSVIPPAGSGYGRTVNYQLIGTYPCRKLIVNYNLGQFSCGYTNGEQCSQIVLYEVSNIIEVYVRDRVTCPGWEGGFGTIGLKGGGANPPSIAAPNRDSSAWTAHHEAWRFTPTGPNVPVTVSWFQEPGHVPIPSSGPGEAVVCPAATTTYTLEGTYQVCGVQQTATSSVTLNVKQDLTGEPNDLTECINEFDLTQNTPVILGALNPLEYEITYHTTLAGAENVTSEAIPLADLTTYAPGGPFGTYTVYASIFLINYNCRVVKPFDLIFSDCVVQPGTVPDLTKCESSSGIGTASFDFTPQTAFALGTNNAADYTITYHLSAADAASNTAISPFTSVTGTNGQVIVVKITENADPTHSATTTFTLHVNPLPTATISGTTTVCKDAASPNITFTGATGTAPYLFTYSTDGGTTTLTVPSVGNTATVAAPTAAVGATTYTLISVQDANCSQTQGGSATVTVKALPTATISGTTTVCRNAPSPNITFTGAGGTAPYTFDYSTDGGTTVITSPPSVGNTLTIAVPTGTAGVFTYTLVGVHSSGTPACSQAQSGSATITVNALPTATVSGTTTVCRNDPSPSITFTGANGTAPYFFTYSTDGGTTTITSPASTGNTYTIPVATGTAGTFTYTLISVQGSGTPVCSQLQPGTATVTVNALPTATISGTTTVCRNAPSPNITFTGAGGTAPYIFTYSTDGGTTTLTTPPSVGNTITIPASTAAVGTITYTLVSVQGSGTPACSQAQSGSASVTVIQLPTATISGTTAVCRNAVSPNITFTGANGTPPYTFVYSTDGGTTTITSPPSVGNTLTIPVSTAVAGTFLYTLISVQSSGALACSQAQSGLATITVNELPTATISGTTSVCIGDTPPVITFTGAAGTSPYTFNYTFNTVPFSANSGSGNSATVAIPSTAAAASFSYNLIDVTDNNGCSQNQPGSATVTVIAAPVINNPTPYVVCDDTLNNDGIYCFTLSTKDNEITGGNPWTVTYHETLTDSQTGGNPKPNVYCNNTPGGQTLYVRVFDPAAPSCYSNTTLQLIVNPIPIPNPVITDYELCDQNAPAGQEVFDLSTKTAEIANGQLNVTVTYYASLPDAQNQTSPLPTLYTAGPNQQIWINIRDNATGCNTTGTFNLIVNPLPTAVTPPTLFECSNGIVLTAQFNLTVNHDAATGGVPGLTVSYYHNPGDAQTASNPIPTPAAYIGFDTEIIYIRVEDNKGCYAITTQLLRVTQGPLALTPQPLQYCDPNNDGNGEFDLNLATDQITGGPLPPGSGISVSYHETPDDAYIGANPIPLTTLYNNITPWSQTLHVRVFYTLTGCANYVQLKLQVNRTPEATNPADYELCDYTGAAHYEAFDLTSTIPQILGSINPATVTVTFYTNLPDAQTPSNAITGVTAYTNGTPDTETLYVRVEFIATGCFDIVPLTLVVNPLPNSTQPNYPQYSLCDNDQSNIGYEIFDLGSKIDDILLGQNGMDVTFYISLGDAQNGTGLITNLMYMNQIQYVQTLGIRITNHDTGCYVISTMDIRVEPLPTLIAPSAPFTLCDGNQDGFTTFDLTTLLPGLLGGVNTYSVTFHETLPDAQINGTSIPNPAAYTNIYPFIQTIYVRAEDNITHCVSIIPIELNVDPSPIAPISLDDITECDDDSNTQNATTAVDLTQQTAAVLSQQPLAAVNYNVTYYTTQAAAQSATGAGQIIQTTNYVGSNNQVIWVRVENKNTHCFNVGSFKLIINIPLLLTTPTPLSLCDDDASPNDQHHEFNLTVRDVMITQGLSGYTVAYYPSYANAQAGVNQIADPTAYVNVPPAVQTLGVLVTSAEGCKSYTTLDIRVLPIPTPNTNPPALAPKCDDNNPGDMMEFFDLTVNAAYIINGDPTLTLHYYHSLADAQVPQNEIATPTNALVGDVDPNEQSVWIRVENNRVDYLGNNCYVLVEQPLTVNPLPAVNPSPDPFRVCDNDTDGIAQFDLTDPLLAPQVLDTATTGQQPADYTITYYLTPADAASGTSPLASPYTNLTNPQDIYIRVVNNATGCVNATGILSLAVEQYATATGPQYFSQCDDYADPYDGIHEIDLTQYEAAILNGQNPAVFIVSYYMTQQDAIDGTNPLSAAEAAAYHNDPPLTDTIWVKVENTSNTITPVCYAITTIEINVEPYPNPVINTPNGVNTICVDFITNAVVRDLTLDAGMAVPSDYTYQWFEAGDPTTVIGTGPTYWVNTSAAGGATRTYTVLVTSNTPLACATTSAPFDVIQSGQAVIPAGSVGYTVTDAFSASQVVTVTVTGYGTYEYSLDDGPRQTSNVFENVSLGTHIIHVWDTEGGVAFSCEELIIEEVQIIDYPHYFTPNGDGIHDTWNIVGLGGQPGAKIYIFDRYGKLLKQISSKGQGWDGTFNGHMLPSDDYWFTVDFEENSTIKQFKAHFTLKR